VKAIFLIFVVLLSQFSAMAEDKEPEFRFDEKTALEAALLRPTEYTVVDRMAALRRHELNLDNIVAEYHRQPENQQDYYNKICKEEACLIVDTHVLSKEEIYGSSPEEDMMEASFGVTGIKLISKEEDKKKWQVRYFRANYADANLADLLVGEKWEVQKPRSSIDGVEIGRFIFQGDEGKNKLLIKAGLNHHREEVDGEKVDYDSYMVGIEYQRIFKVYGQRLRFTFTEGQSYSERVPHYEGIETARNNDGRTSKFMNFLGVSIGINVGDTLGVFGIVALEDCFLETYIWHRSGIFATVDAYNNIKGGSNFIGAATSCSF
jgi:hypothetical protein